MIIAKWQKLTKPTLSRQLIGLILTLYLGIALTLTVLQLFSEFHNEKNNLGRQIEGLGETFRPTITEALWNYEEEQIFAALEGLHKSPEVFGISIKNIDSSVWRLGYFITSQGEYEQDYSNLNMAFTKKTVDLSQPINRIYQAAIPLIKEQDGNLEQIGELTIYYSSSTIIERTWMTFLITVIAALIKSLCLWLVSVWVINKMVAKPINALKNQIDNFDLQSLKIDPINIELTSTSKQNELTALNQSYHTFRHALVASNRTVDEYKHTLELKVAQRTQSLNDTLDELSVANQVKNDFLATMSHEIRTPMNAIIGTSQLLEKTELTEHQTKLLEMISFGGKTLMAILNDILDLSKIEANKLELEHTPFEIVDLLEQCTNLFRANALEKEISLEVQYDKKLHHQIVIGDPTRLGQIVSNLISNAIKFTDKGAVIITLSSSEITSGSLQTRAEGSLQEHAEGSSQDISTYAGAGLPLSILVQDTGIGMSEKQQASIFEAFSQADLSVTRQHGGTGLGLAISLRLVSAMRGSIEVESAIGLGSKFTVTLALPTTQTSENQPCTTGQDKAITNVSTGITILIAEDNEINREIAAAILDDCGYHTLIAVDGQKAVDMVNQHRSNLDLILMDCHMPIMDGLEATKKIRQNEQTMNLSAIPIIALTADALADAQERCLAAGMNGFISKPFYEEDLINAIEKHIDPPSDYSDTNRSKNFTNAASKPAAPV
ncbi:MAG: response regulator [Pseudomonadales bacterium]|nr:response regulator [Pseudomonadales bacterium]